MLSNIPIPIHLLSLEDVGDGGWNTAPSPSTSQPTADGAPVSVGAARCCQVTRLADELARPLLAAVIPKHPSDCLQLADQCVAFLVRHRDLAAPPEFVEALIRRAAVLHGTPWCDMDADPIARECQSMVASLVARFDGTHVRRPSAVRPGNVVEIGHAIALYEDYAAPSRRQWTERFEDTPCNDRARSRQSFESVRAAIANP